MASILRLVLLTCLACGPTTASDDLEENVRTVCELGRGRCYGEGVVEDAVDACVEAQATEGLRRALTLGKTCPDLYTRFFACAAAWTCDDFLDFVNTPAAPCQDLRTVMNEQCPGLSPFAQDRDDPPSFPGTL